MNKLLVLGLAAPLLLIGAAHPGPNAAAGDPPGHLAGQADAEPVAVTYRPCRPGPGDDRCIQLYERGVRAAYARWQRERGAGPAGERHAAVGGPVEERVHRRHRRARHDEHRRAGYDEHQRAGHHGDHHRCPDAAAGDGEARGM